MSTQQEVYAAGSKNRSPMLNKDNYVPWSSRLLRYTKSKPNGKTNDELTEKEVKQIEADDQAIPIILMGLPEDIYAAVNSCETAQEIWFTSTDGESIESYYHHFSKLINDFKRDKHFPEKIASNLKHRCRWLENVENQVIQNVVQNSGVQNVENQNGLIVVLGIVNPNANQIRNGNVVAARAKGNANGNNVRPIKRDASFLQTQLLIAQKEEAGIQLQAEEFDFMAAAGDLEEIKEVNANCILMANLQQAPTSSTQTDSAPVYDSDGSSKVHKYDNCYDNEIFNMFTQEEQYTELLEPILESYQVQPNNSHVMSIVSSVEQSTQNVKNANMTRFRMIKLIMTCNKSSNGLQAQLGDLKGKSKDTPCESDTLDSLSQILENENVELEFQVLNYAKEIAHVKTTYKNLFDFINVTRAQTKTIINSLQNKLHDTIYENAKIRAQLFDKVSEQKDTTKGMSTNTKFSNQSTERKPSLQSIRNNFVVRQPNAFQSERPKLSKTRVPQKVDETNDLINPSKTSREDKFMPINKVRVSVRTNLITISQPYVITKKQVNYDSNGLSSTGVDNTAKTRRMINLKLFVLCASKITANQYVCVLNYVNGMNSRGKKQKANVSNIVNQKKHKPTIRKPNKVGSKERLASPKPKKLRTFLRWSPTRRIFDLKGKIIAFCESECQSDCSIGDNACTSNPQEPTIKRFPNSTSFLGRLSKFVYGVSTHWLFQGIRPGI
ncbi:hypothetical protein Tco_0648786 [Tanacetum coccineum]